MFGADPDDRTQRRTFTRRALLLGAAQAGVFGALGARLYDLQIVNGNRYALLADENRISFELLAPQRGRILDRQGRVLAANAEDFRAVVVPANVRDLRGVLREFSRIIPLGAEDVERVLQRAQRQAPNIAIVLTGELSWEQLAAINLNAPSLPGVRTEAAGRRQYFQGTALGHVVGYTGAIDRLALDDAPVLRLPGMRVGKAGIERGREDVLRGSAGKVTTEVDARGRVVRVIDRIEPRAGRDVTLTIDAALQTAVVEKLSAFRAASSVVLEVANGDILALGSTPGFDPNVLVGGSDGAAWAALQKAAGDPLNSRALRGLYPPGSTFKIVTALAALGSGKIDLKEQLPCEGVYEYGGHSYRCWRRSGHGSSDLHKALRESCDCYFYEAARRAGIEAIAAAARKLGLGVAHATGIAEAKAGLVPDRDWKRGRIGGGWYGGDTVLAGIGQGYVLASPLQLALMTARIASGLSLVPTAVRDDDRQSPAATLPFDAAHIAAVRAGMDAVVNEDGGTGARAQGEDGDYDMAGKTGTAQVSVLSRDSAQADLPWIRRDHALFVCYAPVKAPRFAMATVVEHGGGGGAVAAPLSRAIMDLFMERTPAAQERIMQARAMHSEPSSISPPDKADDDE